MVACQSGDSSDAIVAFDRARALGVVSTAYLGLAHGLAGDRDRAQEALGAIQALRAGGTWSACYPALVAVGLGDQDGAVTWLEALAEERPTNVVLTAWMKPEPVWDPLRQDPRFQALLRRMNFPSAEP